MTKRGTTPDIGQRLSAARLQRGLSQGTVARRAGLAPSYLSRIETGKVHPTFRTVFRIAEAMKVPIEEVASVKGDGDEARGACPVTQHGHCLLDLIRADAEGAHGTSPSDEFYSPRQVRLIRRFAGWLQAAGADRIRAMEILLDDLAAGAAKTEPARSRKAARRR